MQGGEDDEGEPDAEIVDFEDFAAGEPIDDTSVQLSLAHLHSIKMRRRRKRGYKLTQAQRHPETS